MSRWTPDEHGCIYDEAGCFARLTPNKAERLASRHNADIDALTAERDELQRRLDAILDRLPEGGVWCYTCNRATVPVREQEPYKHIPIEYNQMKTIFLCPICRRDGYAKDSCVSTLRAIAEGREG